MKKILLLILIALVNQDEALSQSSTLYNIKIPAINGVDTIRLSDYQGKKILLINSASLVSAVSQLASVEQLFQRYKDSNVVVIVCPSNSFGNEPGSNQEILQFMTSHFSPHFIITGKIEIIGKNAHELYKWIGSKAKNGVMNGKIRTDFTKFLIDGQGQIRGSFSVLVDPQDTVIINAIQNN